jgi:ELWxxDGT repeat protein
MIRSTVILGIVGFLSCYIFSIHTYASEPYIVQDLEVGSSGSGPKYLTEMNSSLFFSAYKVLSAPGVGCELWKSNEAKDNIQLVYDHNADISFTDCPYDLIVFKNKLYFFTYDDSSNFGLWQSDGTTDGTLMLKRVTGNSPTIAGDKLFFIGYDQLAGSELWISDGTTEGTKILKDINPGTSSSGISSVTVVGNKIFFMANDGFHGSELWCSDGTEIGTRMVKEINTQNLGFLPLLVSMNNYLWFTAAGGGLWRSDGTEEGTVIVSNKCYDPRKLVAATNRLYFIGVYERVNSLWVSDGTDAGTNIVMSAPGNPVQLTAVGKRIFFTYSDSFGRELWVSDGTLSGTQMVKDLNPGSPGSGVDNLKDIDGILYFSAIDGIHGAELWRSDGTANGTYMIADIYHANNSSIPKGFTKAGNLMFFTADDGLHGTELWAMPLPQRVLGKVNLTPVINLLLED